MNENKSINSLKKQLVAAVAMVLVAAIALGSSTYAWFVSNTQVRATTSKVQASTAGGNLMIKAGYTEATTQNGGSTVASVSDNSGTAIYPASYNAGTWFIVDGWTTSGQNVLANKYRDSNPTDTAIDGVTGGTRGVWSDGKGNSRNAYLCGTYTIYASNGSYDVYLDPTAPLAITGASANGGAYDALRVGIVIGNTMQVVYAPTTDTGVGNDNSTAVGWRMVTSASAGTTSNASYDVITAVSNGVNVNDKGTTLVANNYCAVKSGADNTYSAPESNAKPLASAVGASGIEVKIYIWMEGTDQQCVIGTADGANDSNTYSVTANFVGVPHTT